MEDALTSLSHNLAEAFQETTSRIQRLPESRKRLGMNTLMWICHSKRPVKVSEVSDALSVKLDQSARSRKHCPSAELMVECCQGLVIIDPDTMNIRFAHYTIQEYLIEHSERLFLRAEANLAEICLTYLLFDTFRQGPCLDEDDIESRIASNPFLSYSARYWGMHVQCSEIDPNVERLTFRFFDSSSAVACAIQIMQFCKGYREEYWCLEECHSTTALHIASHFGLEITLHKLLDQGILPIDGTSKMGSTALIKAASRGHVSLVKLLLQRGANPYLENWYGNSLHCAAEAGYSCTIYELIRHGMSANDCQHYGRIPIYCTLDNDHAAAFETFISLGADMDAHDMGGKSVFHMAALRNCVNIIDLILQRRLADIESKCGSGLRAMHYASIGGNTAIMLKLLQAGAEINPQDNRGKTPLRYAIICENADAILLLMERGAYVVHGVPVSQEV
jgi:ankyrin repeat protein